MQTASDMTMYFVYERHFLKNLYQFIRRCLFCVLGFNNPTDNCAAMKKRKERLLMIILSISATRKDIHWITKGIKKNPRYEICDISEIHSNKKNPKYSHRQIKLQRKDKSHPSRARP